ncbi:hypothetical protein CASFOL_040643 [Castilleja foliolosa]|uniref:Uncharacterized protein n=1 Tax=Castilleja foliolosa TaxID=1961234 RepID=A0ABD3BCE0_9LAMI
MDAVKRRAVKTLIIESPPSRSKPAPKPSASSASSPNHGISGKHILGIIYSTYEYWNNILKSASEVRVLSPPLELQKAVKSSILATIVIIDFDCYYKQILTCLHC